MKTEFNSGMWNLLKSIIVGISLMLSVVYSIVHIIIAITCVTLITGASIELAAIDALVEPIINGFWFYALHSVWKKLQDKPSKRQAITE